VDTDWPSAIGYKISSEVRFEVAHVYFAQHCFFLPLPHVLAASATSNKKKKKKDPGLYKGNTGSQTLD